MHLHSPVDRALWARFPKVGPNGAHNGAQPARTLRGRRAAPRQLRAAAAAAALAERTGARLEKHLIILLVAAIAVRLERTLGMALRRLSLARRPHALLRPHARGAWAVLVQHPRHVLLRNVLELRLGCEQVGLGGGELPLQE